MDNRRHPGLLDSSQAVLVVIDMQDSLLKAVQNSDGLQTQVCRLIQGAAVHGMPIIATTQYAARLGPVFPAAVALLPAAPLDKLSFSAAEDEPFCEALRQTGRQQVVLCGVEAHICVTQTALDLMENGYTVHIPGDAVSSRTAENRQFGLDRMRAAGAQITCVESVLYELLRRAGTPEFKQILNLVR